MNWKLRFKNKATLIALTASVLTFIYMALSIAGITPAITQEQWHSLIAELVNALVILGIVVDPTTKGVGDSIRARNYKELGGE